MECGPGKKPDWLKIRISTGAEFASIRQLLDAKHLHTVCRSAMCPNLQECWSRGTATFLLLGNVCTRTCRFCAVSTAAAPPLPDPAEPDRIAEAVVAMKLGHVVLTSVNRDDLDDGGAAHWAACIQAIRNVRPEAGIECLIPDFQGNDEDADTVFRQMPSVLNHNIETVPRLYSLVRPQANYLGSLSLLARAKERFGLLTKSGLMTGMGETGDEVLSVLQDLRDHGCDMLTIGQYLQPTADHLPVTRYVTPQEFDDYKTFAESIGFRHVQSGPFVRSSYHAETYAEKAD
jgi:lipoic acid synthetase